MVLNVYEILQNLCFLFDQTIVFPITTNNVKSIDGFSNLPVNDNEGPAGACGLIMWLISGEWVDRIMYCKEWVDTIMYCKEWVDIIMYCKFWVDIIMYCTEWVDMIIYCKEWVVMIIYCKELYCILSVVEGSAPNYTIFQCSMLQYSELCCSRMRCIEVTLQCSAMWIKVRWGSVHCKPVMCIAVQCSPALFYCRAMSCSTESHYLWSSKL